MFSYFKSNFARILYVFTKGEPEFCVHRLLSETILREGIRSVDYLHRTHSALLRQGKPTLQRALMNEINWEDRIIGIRGSRGVGEDNLPP